jgi:hypothetical protein
MTVDSPGPGLCRHVSSMGKAMSMLDKLEERQDAIRAALQPGESVL